MITGESAKRAIQHIALTGDTDLFPLLPEMAFYMDNIDQVAATIEKMNVSNYRPISSVEVLTPKSSLGFRIGHQLSAFDAIVYTGAVIENGNGLQKIRSENSEDVAFSYHFDPNGGSRMFQRNRNYQDWLNHLIEFSDDDPFSDALPVLETDISDFYQRIYFHRIENILSDINASRGSANAIKAIVQTTRAKQSFGIPVGSSASRLLAEGLLCDTDKILLDMGLKASRYVDDYKIIANSKYNTHTILCKLAEHLMVTEGLSLNSSKTKITDTRHMQHSARKSLEDVFSSAEMRQLKSYMATVYGDEDGEEDEDPEVDNPFIDGADLLTRMDEIKQRNEHDFSSRKAILKVLRKIGEFDAERLIRNHGDLAYYLPRDFSRALSEAINIDDENIQEIEEKIWDLINTPPVSELSFSRLWLLNLYTNGTLPVHRKLTQLQERQISPLEERQIIFIRALLNDRPYFRDQKSRLGQMGDWIKPAILMGAKCLPNDEYKHWINLAVNQYNSPFSKEFGEWLKRDIDIRALLSV